MISLWNLGLQPEDAAEYEHDSAVVSAWRSWDVVATTLGICCNVVMLSFLVREDILRWHSVVAFVFFLTLQTFQLIELRRISEAQYVLYRYWVCMAHRLLRFAAYVWWIYPSEWGGSRAYVDSVKVVANSTTAWKPLVYIMLCTPLLSLIHSTHHLLPLRSHVLVTIPKIILDIAWTAPSLGCVIMHSKLQAPLNFTCQWMCSHVTSQQRCDCSSPEWAMALSLAASLIVGTFIPLIISYWFELQVKLAFLKAKYPHRLVELPNSFMLRYFLIHQLHGGLLVSLGTAATLTAHAPWLDAARCRAQH
jgi:hypothetical protein